LGVSPFLLDCFNPLGSRAAATAGADRHGRVARAAHFPETRRAVFPKAIVDYYTKLWNIVRSTAKIIVHQCREPTALEKEECGTPEVPHPVTWANFQASVAPTLSVHAHTDGANKSAAPA
jgi:hypothetical protein